MAQNDKSKKVLVGTFILVFWMVCFFEVLFLREDYPFSYFGMYKHGENGMNASVVVYEILVDGKIQNKSHIIKDQYSFIDKIRNLILEEAKSRNDFIVNEAKKDLLGVISGEQKVKIGKLFKDYLLDPSLLSQKPRFIIKIKWWEQLTFENSKTPLKEVIVFDQSFESESI